MLTGKGRVTVGSSGYSESVKKYMTTFAIILASRLRFFPCDLWVLDGMGTNPSMGWNGMEWDGGSLLQVEDTLCRPFGEGRYQMVGGRRQGRQLACSVSTSACKPAG